MPHKDPEARKLYQRTYQRERYRRMRSDSTYMEVRRKRDNARREDPEVRRADAVFVAAWREVHPDANAESSRRWRKANPEKSAAGGNRRRAIKVSVREIVSVLCVLPDGREFCWRCKCPIDPNERHGAGGMVNPLARTQGHEPPLSWCAKNDCDISIVQPEHARCNLWGRANGNAPRWLMPPLPPGIHEGHAGCFV